jgi:hypothetical protein
MTLLDLNIEMKGQGKTSHKTMLPQLIETKRLVSFIHTESFWKECHLQPHPRLSKHGNIEMFNEKEVFVIFSTRIKRHAGAQRLIY